MSKKNLAAKIITSLQALLVGCLFVFLIFGIASKASAGSNCTANVNFNPEFGEGGVVLKGVVTLNNISDGRCKGNAGFVLVDFYKNGNYKNDNNSSNTMGGVPATRLLFTAADEGKPINFSISTDPSNFGVGSGQTLQVVACVQANNTVSGILTCSSGASVAIPSEEGEPDPGTGKPAAPASKTEVDCTKNPDPNNCLYNPLPVSDLTSTLLLIMQGFLGIVGIWAVAFIVIGGFRMVISQGDEEALTAARKTITWAVIGLAIALLSFSIVAIVQNFLQTDIKKVGYNIETKL